LDTPFLTTAARRGGGPPSISTNYRTTSAAPRDAIRISRIGDRLVATIAGGDILAIASALGPNEGRSLDLVPTGPTQFVLLGDTTVLDGAPVSFKVGADGIPMLLLGGAPFGARQ